MKDDSKNPVTVGLRSSGRWQRLRAYSMSLSPVCVVCGEYPAAEVHHIERAEDRPDLFFELSNLAPVCLSCHNKVKNLKARNIDIEMIFPKDKRLKGDCICQA